MRYRLLPGSPTSWRRRAEVWVLAIGMSGYGLSLRLYLLAQRAFGAARTGSVFAFAPFIGALLAIALGDRFLSWGMAAGAALMLSGVALHLAESHAHEHEHETLEHEHAHATTMDTMTMSTVRCPSESTVTGICTSRSAAPI